MNFKVITTAFLFSLIYVSAYSANTTKNKSLVNQIISPLQFGDAHTTKTLGAGRYNINILHRFGKMENGIDDIFGVYAPTNVSMGFGYGITDKTDIYFNSEKNNKVQELGFKWTFLSQNLSNSTPLSVSYNSNLSLNCMKKEYFGDDYSYTDRFSFLNELIISRQFDYKYNISANFRYIHFNSLQKEYQNDFTEIYLNAAYKYSRNKSIFVSWQKPFALKVLDDNSVADFAPNHAIAAGVSIQTRSHNFQIFITNRDNINVGQGVAYSNNAISFKNLRVGFNITIRK